MSNKRQYVPGVMKEVVFVVVIVSVIGAVVFDISRKYYGLSTSVFISGHGFDIQHSTIQ